MNYQTYLMEVASQANLSPDLASQYLARTVLEDMKQDSDVALAVVSRLKYKKTQEQISPPLGSR